jgi:hypothetical protein
LVHLPGSGSVPSWLTNSALAPFVTDAVQLEHLLRAIACAASHRFLLANARRHGTSLASLAACYFFRMVGFLLLRFASVHLWCWVFLPPSVRW